MGANTACAAVGSPPVAVTCGGGYQKTGEAPLEQCDECLNSGNVASWQSPGTSCAIDSCVNGAELLGGQNCVLCTNGANSYGFMDGCNLTGCVTGYEMIGTTQCSACAAANADTYVTDSGCTIATCVSGYTLMGDTCVEPAS